MKGYVMRKIFLTLAISVAAGGYFLSDNALVELTITQTQDILGGAAEGDLDCEATQNACPDQQPPIGAGNSRCSNEGGICTNIDSWCVDSTSEETCTKVTSWGWDCEYLADHICNNRKATCINMLGSLVCAGHVDLGGNEVKCGKVTQCQY
jgi:hypothetical protein